MSSFRPEMDRPPVPDQIMLANRRFAERRQTEPGVINTAVGVIVDEVGAPFMPAVVGEALLDAQERIIQQSETGYQSTRGHAGFLDAIVTHHDLDDPEEVIGVQTSGGTGALHVAAKALPKIFRMHPEEKWVFIDKGWPNHQKIFEDWITDEKGRILTAEGAYDHEHYMNYVNGESGPNEVLLLQASGYNGDGIDRTTEQWSEIVDMIMQDSLIPVIDSAYSGLVSLEDERRDFGPLRELIAEDVPTFLAFSTSKNMGMYGQRLGALLGFNIPESNRPAVQQTLENAVRSTNSNQPLLPALAIADVLQDPEKAAELRRWQQEQQARIHTSRQWFAAHFEPELRRRIEAGRGLFTNLVLDPEGLTKAQHEWIENQGVIALKNGRVNLGGFPGQIELAKAAQVFAKAVQGL